MTANYAEYVSLPAVQSQKQQHLETDTFDIQYPNLAACQKRHNIWLCPETAGDSLRDTACPIPPTSACELTLFDLTKEHNFVRAARFKVNK